jgi:hypothetical protein
MGRSFLSVRMTAKSVSDRFDRIARSLRTEDILRAESLVSMTRQHSYEAFFAFSDPCEAIIFSLLVEMHKAGEPGGSDDVDP